MKHEAKIALCRLVGMLMLTDGFLTDAEHEHFIALMDRLHLDDDGREAVRGSITIDADMRPDVSLLTAAGHAYALLEEMERATGLDDGPSAAEQDLIGRVKALVAQAQA